jgi:peptidoglycan/xylan/chitin deacetylase (PgdA/CDA1 family)
MSVREKALYLTFDDGPIEHVTPWVLDTLKKFDVKATFFCVGDNVRKNRDIYSRILDEGHAVGNHTYNHVNGWKTDTHSYFENIGLCAQEVSSRLFRPPYGRLKRQQYESIVNHYRIVMWDVLSGDFDAATSEEKCLQNVIRYSRNGSIIVFHDSVKAERNMKYALPRTIEYFLDKDYSFRKLAL